MNIIQRALSKFKLQGSEYKENQLVQAVYKYLGASSPQWLDDNFEEYIRKGYAYHIDLYSIINRISTRAAFEFFAGLEMYELNGNEWEQIEGHRALKTLYKPSPSMTGTEYVEQEIGYYLITGNTYTYGIGPENGPNKGEFLELFVMPAQYVEIEYSGNPLDPVKGYQIEWDQSTLINPENVMHRKTFNPNYSYNTGASFYGMSPLRAASRLLTKSNDSYTANTRLLQNTGAIGILSQDATANDRVIMRQEQADMIQKRYKETYGGSENYGKILISAASLKWQQIGMNATDLDLIESMKFDLRKLCSVYNTPSQLFNDGENQTYSNMQEAKKAFITDAVVPHIYRLIDELNRWYIPPFEKTDGKKYKLVFNKKAIPELQVDLNKLADTVNKLWQLTPNESRQLLGYEASENELLDKVYIPTGLQPIDNTGLDPIDLTKNLNL